MYPKTKILAVLVFAGLSAVAGLWILHSHSGTDQSRVPLRVVYKKNANYQAYFIARDRGFLREAGFDVVEDEMESTNLMIQAVGAGRADFNPSTSVPALYAAEQNAPGTFKFLFVTLMEKGRTNDAIIVNKDTKFTNLRDLKGRTIASPPGATSLILLKLILEDAGLDSERDVTIKEMDPRTQLQVLANKKVDAIFALEPLITLGSERGISSVLEAEPMESRIMNPIPIAGGVVAKGFALSHPGETGRLVKAMEKSIDFIRKNEIEAREIMAKAIGMPRGTASRLGINTYWKLGEVDRDYVQRLADLFLRHGALKGPVDTKKMYVESEK